MKASITILGATGLVGSLLLDRVLADDNFTEVIVFGRSSIGKKHAKLTEYLGDLTASNFFKNKPRTDSVAVCIGTTRSKTPDVNTYKKIDYGIPVHAAKWAKEQGSTHFLVVSAMGAKEDSRILYNQLKGTMEKDVLKQNLPSTFILRPSLILGKRGEFRFGEKVGKVLFSVFSFLIPKKYKGIQAEDIAAAMQHLALSDKKGEHILTFHEIKAYA